ncbi:MAG TPA: NAD-dependent epimerase/dehydratase family protein [Candidatus Acidoferrales bacterium]|nr:NAD-dependent epimerase/dehydratase family protein [Candidatus Acidoferrales bacterium]
MPSTQWWKGRKVLVTGGAGFIGSNLVARLAREGARLRVVDNLERGRLEYLDPFVSDVEFVQADLRDDEACLRACADVEVVFHLASKVGGILYYIERAGEVFRANTRIDQNMWTAALDRRVPYYFYASSAHVYPAELQSTPDSPPISEPQALPANPQLSYGWAKLVGERLCLFDAERGCPTRLAIARIIGAYGPNQSVDLATGSAIPVFCRRAIEYPNRGPFVVLGAGRETRSYHYVTDTVEAMLRAVCKLEEKPLVGPFNLGSEQRITIGDLAREVIAVSGKEIEIAWDTSKPTLIWGQVLSCELARQLLDGWQPAVSLRDGLAACYRHIAARLTASAAAES